MNAFPGWAGLLSVLVLVGSADAEPAGNAFPDLRGPYLGQVPPGRTPKLFAPGIVSSGHCNEYVCVFSPDGTECVFDRYCENTPREGEILVSRLVEGRWTEPAPHEFFTRHKAFQPSVTPDGRRWFFTSWSLPVPDGARGALPLYYVDRVGGAWSEPVYFAEGIHASATVEGTVFHDGATANGESHPVFRSPIGDGYSEASYVEGGIAFGTDNAHGVVSPDGRYVLFDSDGLPAVNGCGLFVSFNEDGEWTRPVSLGSAIPLPAAIAWVSADGRYIFFKADGDIYWVSASILDDLRP